MKSAYETLVKVLEDPVGAEVTARLTKNFCDALEHELQKRHNLQELEQLQHFAQRLGAKLNPRTLTP